MANSEMFCAPITPCTWYRGLFLCPLETEGEMMKGKWASFLEKLKDEISSIVLMGKEGGSLLEKLARYLEELGMTGEEISSFLETSFPNMSVTVTVTLTILVLAVMTLLTNETGMPKWLAFSQRWSYGLYISSIWCDLIYTECPIDLSPITISSTQNFIWMALFRFSHEIVIGLHITFFGYHFVLDFILERLVLAHLSLADYSHQLCERSSELCEWLFDTFEFVWDKSAKLWELIIEKVFECHIHMPTLLNLSQRQRKLYRCTLLMVCIASKNDIRSKQFKSLCISSVMFQFGYNFNNIVGNTQLWLGWLTLWQSIKDQLHRQLWLRWLALYENIKERLCKDYLKMPGGLEPNRYHTRYYVGLNRLRVLEYGIIIQVLPDLSHAGIRCFHICGIPVFNGHPVPVPTAPYA